jgi:hypothetical protein
MEDGKSPELKLFRRESKLQKLLKKLRVGNLYQVAAEILNAVKKLFRDPLKIAETSLRLPSQS